MEIDGPVRMGKNLAIDAENECIFISDYIVKKCGIIVFKKKGLYEK